MTSGKSNYHYRIILSISLVTLFSASSAYSWGRLGHRVVAKMAEDRLTPAARTAIRNILGPGTSLAEISNWVDEQKEASGNSSWDYVNVPISESHYDPGYCPSDGCVVSKIKEFKRILEDPKAGEKDKQQALKYFIHLVTDLHQPLHVGDTGSRGGNQIHVLFYKEEANLHQVWDSLAIENYSKNANVWLWELTGKVSPKLKDEWSKGTPEDWATESLLIARKAYSLPGDKTVMKSGSKLEDAYCRMAIPIIQQQLARAGIRISWLLNEMFD
jgi:nuclease S1